MDSGGGATEPPPASNAAGGGGMDGGRAEESSVQPAAPREHFIGTAITFLQNPGVKRNPLNQKQQFLRTKGLTEDEIQIACERAGVFTGISGGGGGGGGADAGAAAGGNTVINMGISAPQSAGKYGGGGGGGGGGWRHQHPLAGLNGAACADKSMLQHIRDMVSASALVAGVAYAVYMFYKNYIRPWLFGRDADGASSAGGNTSARKRRRKTPEELMEDMSRSVEKSVASINQELGRVKEEVARTARQDALHREIGAFKADLDAIKGLLLNRKQFTSPVMPPSIPAWQLQVQQQQQDAVSVGTGTNISGSAAVSKLKDVLDVASCSNSSETEVVNKNSDSSIELI